MYAETAQLHDNKNDGCLMAQNVDWRNPFVRAIETSSPSKSHLDSKAMKHYNLQSSVFGGGYAEQDPIVDRNAPKILYGSNADWKTPAGHANYSNLDREVDTYKMKQSQLASSVIDQTGYSMPQRPQQDEEQQITDAPIAKGRKVNETFKQGAAVFEPHSLHYDPKLRATAVL